MERLGPRELQLVKLVAEGKPNKAIAYEMGLTEGTVKVYMNHALRKLGFSNRTQVAVWLVRALG